MKVLQLCNKPPYPPVDGGTMAMNSITQGLLEAGCEVRVLTVETDKHPLRRESIGEDYLQRTRVEAVYVDLRIKAASALLAMLCGESYHVKRFISDDFAQALKRVLEEETFDVVHVESIFLTPYVPLIRRHTQAPVILRAHNVEHMIWRRVAQSTRNPLKRWYLKHLSLTLRAYELEHINDYDGVVCITQNDADRFRAEGCRRPLVAIPFGIEPEGLDHVEAEPNSLFHIGAMDWLPNQEGVEWLLEKVWPVVHRQVPQARLYLAGRKMPERWMKADIEGVSVVGEVDDAMYFIGSKQINVVPLLSGSGIRVKIIEAMSVGKTVITTSVGAQGIECTDGVDILIANTPEEFAAQIGRCLADKEFADGIGAAASRLIASQYAVDKVTGQLLEFYQKIMKKQ